MYVPIYISFVVEKIIGNIQQGNVPHERLIKAITNISTECDEVDKGCNR